MREQGVKEKENDDAVSGEGEGEEKGEAAENEEGGAGNQGSRARYTDATEVSGGGGRMKLSSSEWGYFYTCVLESECVWCFALLYDLCHLSLRQLSSGRLFH